jgi:hypothetical protein
MDAAGRGVNPVKEEGASAMTKARESTPTVAFVDDYCAHYRSVFPNVRQFEQFTRLELGLLAETKRKSLPRLAQTTKSDPQAFHHFLAAADWSVEALRAVRLELTRQALRERPFSLCIDETGDRKKGKRTDYAAHQYSGNVHTLAHQRRRLGQRRGRPRHRHLPARLQELQAAAATEARRRLQEHAAAGRGADPGAGGAGLPLQRRARGQPVW